MLFIDYIEKIAVYFKDLTKDKIVRIYAQYDPDGISSAAILTKSLLRMNKKFELSFFKQINSKVLSRLKANDKVLVFLDMGSGHLNILKEIIENNKVFIIDHHEPIKYVHENLFHINPHLFDEDPENYCTSILSFIFSLKLDKINEDLVEYMIYGAIGDRKENSQVFKELLKKYNNGKIVVDFGLKFYGRNKPIHKAIAYSFSPLIPNISGNELAAIEFLREIGIETKNGNEWRTVDSLSEMEIRKIVDGLLSYSVNPEDILGENFSVISREGSFSDVREIASIINACSRLGRIEDGFRFCLGDHKVLNSVEDILEDYRKKLSELIEKIEREYIIEKESIIFIISREIPDTLIGVLVSMVSEIKKDKVVFGIGLDEEIGMLKISARSVKNKNINLRNLLVSIVEELGGEAGGHKNAAGAYIPIGKEKDFMEKIEKIFSDKNGKD